MKRELMMKTRETDPSMLKGVKTQIAENNPLAFYVLNNEKKEDRFLFIKFKY